MSQASDNPSTQIRRESRRQLLDLISRSNCISRTELGYHTGMTAAGVSRVTRELIELGLVTEQRSPAAIKRQPGRRSSSLSLNAQGCYVYGVGIANNRRSVSLLDAHGRVLASRDFNEADLSDPRAICAAVAGRIQEIEAMQLASPARVLGIGIAIPQVGAVTDQGIISSTLLGWQNVSLVSMLAKVCVYPVKIASRASSLLLAETRPAQRYRGDVYLINISVGIGAAWSKYQQGLHSEWSLGNIAHLAHPTNNLQCHCGRRGCMERCASGIAIVKELHGDSHSGFDYASLGASLGSTRAAADSGDTEARNAYRRAGSRLAHAVITIDTLLKPSAIILAGQTARQPDYFRGVGNALRRSAHTELLEKLKTSTATTTEAAGITALNHFLFSATLDVDKLRAA